MDSSHKIDFLTNIFYALTIVGITIFILKYLPEYLLPFVVGVVIAYSVQKPAKTISCKIHIKKQICAVILTVIICVMFFAVLLFGIWMIGNKLIKFLSDLPKYFSSIEQVFFEIKDRIAGNMNSLNTTQKDSFEKMLSQTADSFMSGFTRFLSAFATGLIKNFPAYIITGIVTVVSSCYIAKDFDRLKNFVKGIISTDKAKKLSIIKKIMRNNTFKFIKGYSLIMLITFIELTAAFLILNIKNALFAALLIAIVDLLPIFGVGTVLLPWSVIEFLNQNYFLGIGLLISYSVIIVVRNFIEPKIIGSQIGINPIFTLAAMFLGLKISGFTGMLILPLALTIVISYYNEIPAAENTQN
ncbi:MAG: sporulation integral membrane protein YtvI [Clostridia bacterium]|nr:sporulation integral membrane protein YtvI [Clostridia bacterium]